MNGVRELQRVLSTQLCGCYEHVSSHRNNIQRGGWLKRLVVRRLSLDAPIKQRFDEDFGQGQFACYGVDLMLVDCL